jgi:hypothetical protein
MGNVIEWSQIDPTIKGEAPFVGVVIIDPQRRLCVSELIPLDPEQLASADRAAPELIAAAQRAAATVASAYRRQRRAETGLFVLHGGADPGAGSAG